MASLLLVPIVPESQGTGKGTSIYAFYSIVKRCVAEQEKRNRR